MVRIVFWDCDGVLTTARSSWAELWKFFGCDEKENYSKFDGGDWTETELGEANLRAIIEKSGPITWPMMILYLDHMIELRRPYIKEVVTVLHNAGYLNFIVSGGVDLIGIELLTDCGFDGIRANGMVFEMGELTDTYKQCVPFWGKGKVLEELMDTYHARPEHCVYIGDTAVDVPAFQAVGTGIAFNTKDPVCRFHATHCVDSDDLRAVLPIILGEKA